jgi:RNA polymerase sigma-70 factor (sigma-E family)
VAVRAQRSGRGSELGEDPAGGAFAALFRSEYAVLFRLGVLMTRDRQVAEDLVQDAFDRLLGRWDQLEDQSAAAGYLRVSVVNGARSYFRRRSVMLRHVRPAAPMHSPSADEEVLRTEEYEAVWAAVRALPRRQHQVMTLRYWADMSDAEIAAALGISQVTVRATCSKATAALGRTLTP